MTADALVRFCPDCGRQMKVLARSFFCPNDCDRHPAGAVTHSASDFEVEESTALICPHCGGTDVTVTTTPSNLAECAGCKHRWWV